MNSRLDSLDLDALPADVRVVLLAEHAARIKAEERVDQLQTYANRLAHLVMEFKKARFGKKSEKLNPDQLNLVFEELETALSFLVGRLRLPKPRRPKIMPRRKAVPRAASRSRTPNAILGICR